MPKKRSPETLRLSRASYQKRSLVVWRAQVLALALGSGGHDYAHDEPVQAERLCEDEDQNHAHKEPRLLCVRADACIANDANCQSCCQGAHANCEASAKMRVAGVCRVGCGLHLAIDNDSGDQAIDTQDASHDNWNDGAHDHVWPH